MLVIGAIAITSGYFEASTGYRTWLAGPTVFHETVFPDGQFNATLSLESNRTFSLLMEIPSVLPSDLLLQQGIGVSANVSGQVIATISKVINSSTQTRVFNATFSSYVNRSLPLAPGPPHFCKEDGPEGMRLDN
jgi:hypothetical protein